ncbi:hypothetical protein ACFW1A_01615 [Kitasatospora sp. NPDC058965]|uniref:hypothetical protein n=1 Tax=Kitasatospora sp. NPDC058965 TaxID=3346682 RepID=UPI0036B34395
MTLPHPDLPSTPADTRLDHAQRLLAWAGDGSGHPRAALVVGPRGAGKSRLLAWLVAQGADTPAATVHAVGLAAGQTARTLAWQLGRDLGYGPLEPEQLTGRIAADPRPVRLVVADLHRAGRYPTRSPRNTVPAVLTDLLLPLLALPQVRMAIESDTAELPGLADDALVLDLSGTPSPRGADAPPPPGAADAPPPPGADTPGQDWRLVDPSTRELALDRATAAGTAPALLADPGYLVHGPVTAITAALAETGLRVPRRLRTVWDAAAPALADPHLPDQARAAVLHTAAVGRDDRLAEYLRPLVQPGPWTTRWSLPHRPANAVALLGTGTGTGTGQAAGSPVAAVVVADPLGRLTQLSLADGRVTDRFTPEPPWAPAALATATPDCLLALDRSGALRPVPATADAAVPLALNRLVLHHNAASLLADAQRPTALATAGRYLAIGDQDGTVHLWRRDDLLAEPTTARLHHSAVTALACLETPDGRTALVVTGGLDGTLRLWDSDTGGDLPEPLHRRRAVPTALALTATPAGLLLAAAWSDRQLRLTLLPSGEQAALPTLSPVEALAVTAEGLLVMAGPGGVQCVATDFFPVQVSAPTGEPSGI